MPPVNYLAIVVAALSAIILGFLWYGPFFGKEWMKLMGLDKSSMDKTKNKGMGKTYALMAISTLIMAYILSHVTTFAIAYTKSSGISAGLSSGFWMWLGFAIPLLLDGQLWERKPWKLFWINASYRLVSFLIMGVILATWL